jgi:uncharacterized integral membrane protein (TIGR00697 family)
MKDITLSFDDNWSPKYFHIIAICLGAALIITNVFSFKFIDVFGFKFGAGAILFPFCLILGDILTEIYGFRRARHVIITSLVCFFFYALVSQIIIALPPAPGWPHQEMFKTIFSLAPRIFIAGALAYLAGELCNSFIMSRMKIRDKGRYFYSRAMTSTIFGELVNSAVFFTIAFAGSYSFALIVTLIINGTVLKTFIEALVLPLTTLIVRRIKILENVDHFDQKIALTATT